MKKSIRYTDEPMGKLEMVDDFLPPPEALVLREESVKVTLALSKRSVEFFKREAGKHKSQYQRMIRGLVDAYVDRFSDIEHGPGPRVRLNQNGGATKARASAVRRKAS